MNCSGHLWTPAHGSPAVVETSPQFVEPYIGFEIGHDRTSAGEEELDGFLAGEWLNRVEMLTLQRKTLATCDQNVHVTAVRKKCGERWPCRDDMLKVVEEKRDVAIAYSLGG